MVDMLFKKPGQRLVLRCQVALAHDPSGPLSVGIKDQQAPAAIVPADLRARQVDGTVPFRGCPVIPEKRAGLGTFPENARVIEEGNLVGVNGNGCFFTRVLVLHEETVIPVVLLYEMDQPEMAAAFTALAAFKWHSCHPDRIPGIALTQLNFTGTWYNDLQKMMIGSPRSRGALQTQGNNEGEYLRKSGSFIGTGKRSLIRKPAQQSSELFYSFRNVDIRPRDGRRKETSKLAC